ncbi:MAG: AAA family ATPase [Mangrovibacterium sp.]
MAEFQVINLQLPLVGSKQEKDVSDYFRQGNTAADLRLLFTQKLDAMYEENLDLLRSCEVDLKHPPPLTRAIIATHGTAIASEGNLLCITGSEGSGKSSYIAALLAGCIVSEKKEVDCLGMEVAPNVRARSVLMYDTEQSEVQLFNHVQRMLLRAQREALPEFFHAFSLSSIPRKTRLDCIEQSMDKFFYQHGGIQLVVIDGIADLISSANDEGESTLLVERLHRMASSYNTCIIAVLHFVPNGIKLRGHLGSELQRKAASILAIEQEKDRLHSVVKAIKIREGSPLDVPLMLFAWDKTLAMHRYAGIKSEEATEQRKEKMLAQTAQRIFADKQSFNYTELSEALQDEVGVKERTAKDYIRFMLEHGIVTKSADDAKAFYLIQSN